MKAIGGVGNGVFECVQDVIGYMNLCYIASDDPDLYEVLFKKVGDVSLAIWKRFLELYGDIYCVLRFGDDLGFKSNTLISPDDIRRHIIPQYTRIIALIHSYNKPFLLHSCGCIFEVMPDIISKAKIDAKHSNEDQIAKFLVWVEKYGNEIGNFGGIDTDAVCRLSLPEIRDYIEDLLGRCKKPGGIAFSSGNTIPDYVPADHYLEMVNTVRKHRGDS
jgi:uroporphyrinogen decarboxylase